MVGSDADGEDKTTPDVGDDGSVLHKSTEGAMYIQKHIKHVRRETTIKHETQQGERAREQRENISI